MIIVTSSQLTRQNSNEMNMEWSIHSDFNPGAMLWLDKLKNKDSIVHWTLFYTLKMYTWWIVQQRIVHQWIVHMENGTPRKMYTRQIVHLVNCTPCELYTQNMNCTPEKGTPWTLYPLGAKPFLDAILTKTSMTPVITHLNTHTM